MIALSGYTVTKEIYSDARIGIYRGYNHDDHATPVILKVLKTDYPTPKEIAQFRHEYEITKELNLTGAIKPYQLQKYNNGLALILEDVGGESLQNIIADKRINLVTFLKIAWQLANVVDELHQHNIIHKDIKPANIIVHLETGQVKMTDFSIATRWSAEESTSLVVPQQLEGTLAYMSPEQTGRMNRTLDYRTDFYSLGVTFYEMLVGWLPFQSSEPTELIHSHLAKVPLAPHTLNPDIPPAVSDIVMKLLAKNVEERYQTAHGLKIDLQIGLHEWTTQGKITRFRLGQQDLTDKFQIPSKLYGRAMETAALLEAFAKVGRGNLAVVLVQGEVGMGKTTLVQDLQKTVTRKQGLFVGGKFESFKQTLPYSAIIVALRELVLQLLSKTTVEVTGWQQQVLAALGNHAQVIIPVIPELELLLGKQPAIEELNATGTQNRFSLLLEKFIRVFAQPPHPLVICLDDLQWSDVASLKLLETLISDPEPGALLLVGSYRPLSEATPLQSFLNTLKAESLDQCLLTEITLVPLQREHINQLLADTLHCTLSYAQGLADIVFSKTEGNPFFVREFLKNLYQDKLLRFDSIQKCWHWEVKAIVNLEMANNVVELTGQRCQKLPAQTQEIIKLAACIGRQFDIPTLVKLSQQAETAITSALWVAVEENLVIPEGDAYQWLYDGNLEDLNPSDLNFVKATYRFVHERIQQAAYSMLSAVQKQAVHYQLGQYLREHTAPGHLEEHLVDIVNHLNLGRGLLKIQAERDELARLNLAVGKKVKVAGSYESARNYFQQGLALLEEDSWKPQYNLTLALHTQLMEVEYLQGEVTHADQLFTHVLKQANTLLDQVKAYEIKILSYLSQNQMQKALETGLYVLQLLNIKLPKASENLLELFRALQDRLAGRSLAELVNLPTMKDPHKRAALQILVHISASTYLVAPNLYPLLCFTQVKLCIEYGNSPLSAYAYAAYSLILCGVFNDLESGYRLGQVALQMLERFETKEHVAKVLMLVNAGTRHWKEPARHTLTPLFTATEIGLATGDIEYAGYAAMLYSVYTFLTGEELETVIRHYQHYVELMIKFKQQFQVRYTQLWQQFALNLRGAATQPTRLIGESFDEDVSLPLFLKQNQASALFSAYLAKSWLCYLFKDSKQALTHIEVADRYVTGDNTFFHYTFHNFYYSLILLANCPRVVAHKQVDYLHQVRKNQVILWHWAKHAPANYQHKYDLVSAEQARVLGQIPQALVAYEQAIKGAQAQGYLSDEALANELAAECYASLGVNKIAQVYWKEAHYAYVKWGATAKVKALEISHPFLSHRPLSLESPRNATQTATVASTSHQGESSHTLDLAAVMKISQAISGELVLNQLIEKLLSIVVENAGAQKGLLILERDGELYVEAEVHADQTGSMRLPSVPLETLGHDQNNSLLPVTMINYVVRTKSQVVLNDATNSGMFTDDPYISRYQPKSVLCSPLLNQGLLIGLLYLENNLITHAFTLDRLTILRLLSTQIAISIENALFYAKLEQARQAAEAANHIKNRFLMNMSHELRTPLNAILGYAEIIHEDAKDLGYQAILPDLEKIQTAGQQLLEIVSNVLDISKIEANQMGLNLDTFEVVRLVNDVVSMIQPSVGNNKLEVVCGDKLGMMYADQTKVQQIVLNLLSNAVKFTRQGTITFTVIRHHAIPGQSNTNCDRVRFEIADTGIGMTPEQIEHIFEAFHQVDSSTTRQYGGTGLGLTISEHFCRMMGGRIMVSSEFGQGSIFTVQLPSQVSIVDK
jgi:predicted ATPase/signal transduction histidine kinase